MRLTKHDQQVRYLIVLQFIQKGTAPSLDELCAQLEETSEEVAKALKRLEEAHALVLAPATSNIWMLHPFSAVPTHHIVHTDERYYWANCGWDLLGVPVVIGKDSNIHVPCTHCDEKVKIVIRDGEVVEGDAVVHFTVPARRFWDNVGYT